jgi:hypothetical protein
LLVSEGFTGTIEDLNSLRWWSSQCQVVKFDEPSKPVESSKLTTDFVLGLTGLYSLGFIGLYWASLGSSCGMLISI